MPNENQVAIMQPYFLPYLGYWQLMNCVDTFVLYDDIQFTKKGWIHRNRYLSNGRDQMFTLPLKKDSDYLDIVERKLADSWDNEKKKLRNKIEGVYKKAPNYGEGIEIFEECLNSESKNLFEFIFNSIKLVKNKIGIQTELKVSSDISDSKDLKGQDRVLKICKDLGATEYINPIGGQSLYSKKDFSSHGIALKFHSIGPVKYDQMQDNFLPHLSILDMLMFVGSESVREQLTNFQLK